MAKTRKDSKGRVLRRGESQRKQDGRYIFAYTSPYKKRVMVYGKTLEELRSKEAEIFKDRIEGIDSYVAAKVTLNYVFDKYMEYKTELRSSTEANYRYMYDHFVRKSFGMLKIGSIKYSDVSNYYRKLLNKVSINTLENVHSVIHPTFQMALRDNIIRFNPSDGVMAEIKKKFRGKHPSMRHALTLEQQQAFIKYVADSPVYHRWAPLFTVMLGTGCRVGEIVGLRWRDIDLKDRMIEINHNVTYYARKEGSYKCSYEVSLPKTEAGIRTIPMLDEVYEAFLEEKEYQKVTGHCKSKINGMTGFIFHNKDGQIHNPQGINRAIKRIVENYNSEEIVRAERRRRKPIILPAFSCHILRHTFCTRLCEHETNIKVIQAIMGHADIQTTYDIYAEVTDLKKKQSFESLAQNMKIF